MFQSIGPTSTWKQASKSVYRLRNDEVSRTPAIMTLGGYAPSARMKRIFTVLDRPFPNARCVLTHRVQFELLEATILSAPCKDKRVNQITPALFQWYPTPEGFAALQPEVLERDIYSTGFFRSKARNIATMSKGVVQKFDGKVPRTTEELLTLPGVARMTVRAPVRSPSAFSPA